MQGVYFDIAHVPFTAPPSLYPGLKLYFAQMKKYEPKYAHGRDRHPGVGVGLPLRPGRQDGRATT